jgi:hypothetical protein
MKCPNCGLINPATVQRCDCGFDFVSRAIKTSFVGPEELRRLSATQILFTCHSWVDLFGYSNGYTKRSAARGADGTSSNPPTTERRGSVPTRRSFVNTVNGKVPSQIAV